MTETLVTSSVLILIIIILRTVFKGRIKSTVRYALWLIAAVRLMLPFSLIESSVSVMNLINSLPEAEVQQETDTYVPAESYYVPEQAYTAYEPSDSYSYDSYDREAYTELPAVGYSTAQSEYVPVHYDAPAKREQVSLKTVAIAVWISGTAVMLVWFAAVNCLFYAGMRRSRKETGYTAPLKVYRTSGILSPCIFGLIKPSIYIPEEPECSDESLEFVVTHELCHYYHGDMVWAVLRYILLAVYWFDPFVWAAAVLSKQDCECACDESAIYKVGEDRRFEYGKAVIDLIPRKRGEMFGVASTSMASSKNVLKERMTMIAAKPKNRFFAIACSVIAVIFAACGTFTSAVNDDDVYTDEDISAGTEEPAEKVSAAYTEAETTLSISVTDHTGADRTLYYIAPPDDSLEAFVYMNDISELSGITTAGTGEVRFGESMREFVTLSRFSKADITVDGETKALTRSETPADLDALFEALCSLDPEYCSEAVSGEPFAVINFSRENGGFSSSLTVTFYRAGDRIAGRITAEDYSEMVSVITSDVRLPQPESITEAYDSSVHAVSEFFYAENTRLYEFAAGLFKGDTKDDTTEYVMTQIGNVLLEVPDDGNVSIIDTLLLWQMKDMSLRITQNGIKTPPEGAYSETVSFDGRDGIYYEDSAKNEMGLIFSDYDGNTYTASFEYKSEDGMDTGRKIFGSIHLAEKPAAPVYVPAVALSSQPSIYGDENYDIAEPDGWWYERNFRANCPAVLVTRFQITNGVKDYETNFDCYIEKQEPDGKWYRVIPLADIVQVNSGYKRFYTNDETGGISCCLDLSCYPLLPAGKYRLVKPFRLKGSDSDDYAALFNFYMDDTLKPEGELLCTAECKTGEISPDAKTITYEIKSNKVLFALSEIADIERETPNGWRSVRTGSIRTNTLTAGFPLGFAGEHTLDTSDFDISVSGNYRIRISYGNCDSNLDVRNNGYDTAYAYFKVK